MRYRIQYGSDSAMVEVGMPHDPILVDGKEIGRLCAEGYRLGGPPRSTEGVMRIAAHHIWGREVSDGAGWDDVSYEPAPAPIVLDYDTGAVLVGNASDELVRESRAAGPTGAVPAYRDCSNVWQYVRPDDVETERRLGHGVVVVYVVED